MCLEEVVRKSGVSECSCLVDKNATGIIGDGEWGLGRVLRLKLATIKKDVRSYAAEMS